MTLSELIDVITSMKDDPGECEGLTELDHGLQCAYQLTLVRPGDLELQVAGLVHDIGHRFGPDAEHGRLGAEQVRHTLGDRVASLVEGHVQAKRYLVATDSSYRAVLSAVSTTSLHQQGGPLSPGQVTEFQSSQHWADAVLLRRCDEAAKVPGCVVPSVAHWIPLLQRLAS